MKVIVVNDFAFVNGGAGQVAVTTAKLLAKKGHRVTFFSAVGPIGQELKDVQNLSVICLNQKIFFEIRTVYELFFKACGIFVRRRPFLLFCRIVHHVIR